jgi:chromate transporter
MAVAIVPLARTAARTSWGVVMLAALVGLYLLGLPELALLGAGALAYAAPKLTRVGVLLWAMVFPVQAAAQAATDGTEITVRPGAIDLFLAFLRIGSILYGSGYVLIAFLEAEFVRERHWLTHQQLVDAIAVGQVTPGPVFSASTFIGYVTSGYLGAAAATLGIFLPAFVFVLVTHGWVARIRQSPTLSVLLDGLNLASTALLIGVLARLARGLELTSLTPFVVVLAAAGLLTGRLGPTSVLLLSGALGLIWQLA